MFLRTLNELICVLMLRPYFYYSFTVRQITQDGESEDEEESETELDDTVDSGRNGLHNGNVLLHALFSYVVSFTCMFLSDNS